LFLIEWCLGLLNIVVLMDIELFLLVLFLEVVEMFGLPTI